jgi:glycosyltransferase involved in cell wall biosynthesis
MNEILISVIVPVYNTADYLVECIESALKQTLKQLEIILVDDGSEDASLDILEHYAGSYSNVTCLKQIRKRQGAARNLALQHAKGKYVAFLDSDDTVPKNAYQLMYEAAEKNGSDLVVGIQQSFSKGRTWIGVPVHQKEFSRRVDRTCLKEMPSLIGDISACNRLIRRSTLDEHQIRFLEGTSGEDLNFMARLYLVAKSITVLPVVVYNYRGREDSLTSRLDSSFFEGRVSVTEGLEDCFHRHEAMPIYQALLRSEVRKLVGSRFLRVMLQSPHDEQIRIFEIIGRLIARFAREDIFSDQDFSLRKRVRIIMLRMKEYDALIAYERAPRSLGFLPLIRSEETKALMFETLLIMWYNDNNREFARYNRVNLLQNPRFFSLVERLSHYADSLLKLGSAVKVLPVLNYFAIAPLAMLNNWISPKKNIWLIDERVSASAEDNSYFFFKYLREKHSEIPAYYVINPGSPQRKFVENLGNIIEQYSLRHAYLLWRAKALVSTDNFRSLAYPYELFPSLRRKTHNVFLQHGVAGNKTMTYTRENYPYFSQIIVSNEIEKQFFASHYCFAPSAVTMTGIARFDNLIPRRSPIRSRKILVAPTWRKWLKRLATLKTTKYYSAWNKLITSPQLAELLDRYEATLYFRPHFNMMHFISEFETSSTRVHVIKDLNEPLHQLIKEADMLITDYSSVMYDFFYQEKPVIAYMFDRHEWEVQPPGPPHLDYEQDLAADIAYDEETVLGELEWYLGNDFVMRDAHLDRLGKLFTYRDQDNCERIYRSICAGLSEA